MVAESRTDATFDEVGSAGQEHLDATYVDGYDRKAGVDPTDDLAVLRRFGLSAGSTLVDLGAGTGVVALAAAPHCRRVVAVDVSPVMLARLDERVRESGATNVESVRAGFLSYVHSGEPAGFAYTRHALHHLPDYWKAMALRRIATLLKPRGVLVLRDIVYSFEPDEAEARIEAWLAKSSSSPEVGWTRAELETHVLEEHSTFSWLLEELLDHAGFEVLEADFSESGIFARYTCVAREVETGGRVTASTPPRS